MKRILLIILFIICFPVFADPPFVMTVFNVGAANFVLFSAVDSEGKRSHLIVDAGFDRHEASFIDVSRVCGYKKPNSDSVVRELISMIDGEPFSVIISHLDSDHYNLLQELTGSGLHAKRVVVGKDSVSALPREIMQLSTNVFAIQNSADGLVVFSSLMTASPSPLLSHTSSTSSTSPVSSFDIARSLEKCLGDEIRVKILFPVDHIKKNKREYSQPTCRLYHPSLTPEMDKKTEEDEEKNDNSLVVFVEAFGRKVLVCGDANMNLLSAIQTANRELQHPVDVLVPSHHLSISHGERGAILLFKPGLCICSTRPHNQYHFPRSFIGNLPFHWSVPAFVVPHAFSCWGPVEFDSGNIDSLPLNSGSESSLSGSVSPSICKFNNLLTPIFSTFDSNALFYQLDINYEGVMKLCANGRLLFWSFELLIERLIRRDIFTDTSEPIEPIKMIIPTQNNKLTSLLLLSHILNDACDYIGGLAALKKHNSIILDTLTQIMGGMNLSSFSNIMEHPEFVSAIVVKLSRFFLNQGDDSYVHFATTLFKSPLLRYATLPRPRLAIGTEITLLKGNYNSFMSYIEEKFMSSPLQE